MAIFGAPLAHENDPERAVRCALDMVADIEHFNTHSPVKLPDPARPARGAALRASSSPGTWEATSG